MMSERQEAIGTSDKPKEEPVPKKKVDVAKLLSIIPPASELKRRETRLREKRVRVRYGESLPPKTVRLPKQLAEMLGIKEGDLVEIVIAGRHKFMYSAQVVEEGSVNEVYCNPEELRERGVADNSIATVRKHGGGG